jgi:multisubunit Na+/H+ antiporter MnhG subunit
VSVRDLAVDVLLGLAALVVVLAAVGLVAAPTLLARLHFLGPVTSLAGPLVAAAYVVDQGPGLAAGLVVATVAVVALTGPTLSSAIGRLDEGQRDGLPTGPPEEAAR